ncbi:MAG: cytochrome c [Chloroflexi bacterium]|nr:cytochrome c [Chloroflexota bacterium]
MNRYFVPAILAFAISGLAVTIIAVVVARSPYTHGNLASAAGYTRTKVAYVGEEYAFEGVPLAKPAEAQTGDPVHDGGLLFFRYGCAACHGSSGAGGAVGKDLSDASASKIKAKVRDGPKGMPVFSADALPDADMQKLIAFLQSSQK